MGGGPGGRGMWNHHPEGGTINQRKGLTVRGGRSAKTEEDQQPREEDQQPRKEDQQLREEDQQPQNEDQQPRKEDKQPQKEDQHSQKEYQQPKLEGFSIERKEQ